MDDKQQALAALRKTYKRWEALLDSMSEAEITTSRLPDMSVRDVVTHLWAWQQTTVARMEAALNDHKPVFPDWSMGENPDAGDTNETNARIMVTNVDKSWSEVYRDWRTQFLRLLELAETVPERDLVGIGKYPWIEQGYVLLDVLKGSDEHHEEHLESLLAERA